VCVCVFACDGPEVDSDTRVVPFHQAGNMGEPTNQVSNLDLTTGAGCVCLVWIVPVLSVPHVSVAGLLLAIGLLDRGYGNL
jgi:hypothetical protein